MYQRSRWTIGAGHVHYYSLIYGVQGLGGVVNHAKAFFTLTTPSINIDLKNDLGYLLLKDYRPLFNDKPNLSFIVTRDGFSIYSTAPLGIKNGSEMELMEDSQRYKYEEFK